MRPIWLTLGPVVTYAVTWAMLFALMTWTVPDIWRALAAWSAGMVAFVMATMVARRWA